MAEATDRTSTTAPDENGPDAPAELAEYVRQKLELQVADFAGRVRQLSKGYLAEVERLARRTRDPWMARYYRETMDPGLIKLRLGQILNLARTGKLIRADSPSNSLRAELQSIDGLLQRRYLSAGLGKVQGAETATVRRQAKAADRHDKIHKRFTALRRSGLSKGDAEKRTADQFSCGVRTVRKAVRGK